MLYLECEIRKPSGLREADVLALVSDHTGHQEQIEVENAFLVNRRGRLFLPVWGLAQDLKQQLVEIELPRESAGGTNRIWVPADRIYFQQEETLP